MEKLPFDLMDLVPRETTFTLSTLPDKPLTLCRWSLRVRAWASAKYTPEGLQNIFKTMKIEEIAEMAFFMLKEKDQFKSKDDFLDLIASMKDQFAVINALLGAVGIGEPEMKAVKEQLAKSAKESPDPLAKSPKKRIGAKSSTP